MILIVILTFLQTVYSSIELDNILIGVGATRLLFLDAPILIIFVG